MLPELKVASPESTIKSVELRAAISRVPDHFPPALVAVDVLGLPTPRPHAHFGFATAL